MSFDQGGNAEEMSTMNAKAMRMNAENCLVLAESANGKPSRARYMRMAAAWNSLANNKDWLDGVLVSNHATLQPELHKLA
jgi:hypothetical protein